MAYSTQRAVSNGTLAYLDLAIGYQSRSDIRVFYNNLPANPATWAWVGTTDKRIAFTPNVPNGVEVLIQRTTRLDRIINVFARGAKFTNATMDMNFEQVLFLTQEAVEGAKLSDIYNDVDFHSYKIKNLGLAVDDSDAITFGQVKSFGTGAYAAQLAAEAARDLAALWATKLTTTVDGTSFSAKQYALNAGTSAGAAAGSATAANTSATNSASSAAASQTSRLASEAARDRSEAARDRAEGAAAPATAIYTRLDNLDTKVNALPATFVTSVVGQTGAITAAQINSAAGPTAPVSADQAAAIAASAVPVGQYGQGLRKTVPAGYVRALAGTTMGNTGSGATYTGAAYQALYNLWWGDFTNAELAIFTNAGAASTRGASAAVDWAAGKRLAVFGMDGLHARNEGTDPNGITVTIGTYRQDRLQGHVHNDTINISTIVGGDSTGYSVGSVYTNNSAAQRASLANASTLAGYGVVSPGLETEVVTRGMMGYWKL